MKRRNLPFSLILIFIVLGGFAFSFFSLADPPHYKPRDQKDKLNKRANKPAARFLAQIRNNQHTGVIRPEDFKRVQSELENISSSRAVDPEWKQMGPDNFGGRTRAIICKQTAENNIEIFAAGVSGGIWKSTNLGTTWAKINADNDNLNVSCMAMSDNGTVYAGTGETFDTHILSGFDEMGYTSGFMGQGIFKSTDGNSFTLIPSTKPEFNDLNSDWAFVNEIAVHGNDVIYAATNNGLKYSLDAGATWETATDTAGNVLDQFAWDVQIGSDGNIVACVDNMGYISTDGNPNLFVHRSTGDSVSLPMSDEVNRIEFAIAPSDANIVYASVVGTDDDVYNIYKSDDKGVNWRIIMPGTSSINVFNEQGTYSNALVVFPNNPNKVILGGIDMWQGEMYQETGFYDWNAVSESVTGPLFPSFVHADHHTYAFVPGNDNLFFAGTDGGVYKGNISSQGYTFETANRNYFTSQFYAVGMSGLKHMMVGGAQDISTVMITGEGNTQSRGTEIFEGEGGPCAISIVNPNIVIVSSEDGVFRRSDDRGVNYSTYEQFPANDDITNSAFRTALLLSENFTNENSADSVYYYAKETVTPGTTVQVISHNEGHPFPYVIPEGVTLEAGDSLLVKDIVTSYLYVAVQHNVWMCPNVLQFAETAEWFRLTNPSYGFVGRPYSMALSSDGNHMFVGTLEGRLYRLSNLATANTFERADLESPGSVVATQEIILTVPGSGDQVSQVVTGISIDPQDPNNVMITLGNYGNEHYVFYSENALDQNPVFESRQGNLPHMPVYSCLIEMSNTDLAFAGTEHGVFVTENIHASNPQWNDATGLMGKVAVMQMSQQLVDQPERRVSFVNAEGQTEYSIFPGTKNYGSIYLATYGRGLWRNDDFYLVSAPEFEANDPSAGQLKLYPNPVRQNTTVELNLPGNANVVFRVFDITGKQILQQDQVMNKGANKMNFDFSHLQKGAYVIQAEANGKIFTQKFIKN